MYEKAKFSPLLQASSLGTNMYLGGSSEEGGCSTTCFVQKTNGRGEGKVSFRSSEQHDKLWWFYGMSVCRGDKTSKTDLVVTTLFTITELQVLLEHSERQPEETHQPGQTRFQAADPERRLSLHFPKQTKSCFAFGMLKLPILWVPEGMTTGLPASGHFAPLGKASPGACRQLLKKPSSGTARGRWDLVYCCQRTERDAVSVSKHTTEF